MEKINWGIIGCGDVTEIKSGPAFNKVPHSRLVAVMRRDAAKAKDYARRHGVPHWYSNADALINNPDVNAVYVATPPSSHETFAIAALQAGKPVYVEKPMSLHYESALHMADAAKAAGIKMCVAHYRREQPYFKKIKQLIDEKTIGDVSIVQLSFFKKQLSKDELNLPGNAWRVNPETSGGGLFHDLAPHQLDLMYYFFGEAKSIKAMAINQSGSYNADDVIAGNIIFNNNILFNGTWNFNVIKENEKDECIVIGSKGSLRFSVFGRQEIFINVNNKTDVISFDPLEHVQQPMIEKVVAYFLGKGTNPCSGYDGAKVMKMIDAFTTE